MQDLAVFRGRARVGGAEAARAGPGDAPLGRGELAAVGHRSGPHLKKRADLQQRAIYRLQLLVGNSPPLQGLRGSDNYRMVDAVELEHAVEVLLHRITTVGLAPRG